MNMKCSEHQFEDFDLDGLPDGCNIHWNHLPRSSKHSWLDQDMVWLELPNGIGVDCGAYGREDRILRVDVLFTKWGWHRIESSLCRHTEEAAQEIVRLANKFMDAQLFELARSMSHNRMKYEWGKKEKKWDRF